MADSEAGTSSGSEGPNTEPEDPGGTALTQTHEALSDSVLVVAIGRRQQAALAEVYRRHGGAVYALASRILSDPARAEDVVQEVFLRLWARPESFDPERGRLRAYLLAQAHGRAVDVVRADVSRRRREEHSTALGPPASSGDVDAEVWREAVTGRVREAMSSLPENQRRALELAYFGGQTCRQIATTLGEPEGTVKSRIRAGLRRMRAELVSAGIEPS